MTWQRVFENPLRYSDAHDAWCDTRTGRCGPNAPAARRDNPKASVEAAVKAWQMYYGADGLDIKRQQRFYNRAKKLTDKVATQHGMSSLSAHEQIQGEAARRGKIYPLPGKDY